MPQLALCREPETFIRKDESAPFTATQEDHSIPAIRCIVPTAEAESLCRDGLLAALGISGKPDYQTAEKAWLASARLGDANAMFNLGELHAENKDWSMEHQVSISLLWWEHAAYLGNIPSMARLRSMTLDSINWRIGDGSAISELWCTIRFHLWISTELEIERERNREIYRMLDIDARKSYPDPISLYMGDIGPELMILNDTTSWNTPRKEQGKAGIYARLGYLYAKGIGIEQSFTHAKEAWELAADHGSTDAVFHLGQLRAVGFGGEKRDYAQAKTLFETAAHRGHPEAMHNLGTMYWFGDGTEQNYDVAKKWWKKAADRGSMYAMYKLADMYELGYSVEQDHLKSLHWQNKAYKEWQNRSK